MPVQPISDLLYRLASAIATAEGFYAADPKVVPRRDHNPGDVTASPWLHRPMDGRFVRFGSDAEGIAGLYHLIALKISEGMTLAQLVTSWAPPGENDTANYIHETVRRIGSGIDPAVPLWEYLSIERIP